MSTTDDIEAEASAKADLAIVWRLLAYLRHDKRLLFSSLLFYPLDALAVVLPPYFVQQMLDVAVPKHDMDGLWRFGGLYLAALGLEYATGFVSQMTLSVLGQRAMQKLRADLFAHALRLPASFYDRTPLGRVLTRLTNDVEALGEVFASGAITVITDILTLVAVVVSMLLLDVKLTAFSFLVVPPLILVSLYFQRIARRAFRGIRRSIARINAFLAEHLAGMAAVQVFRQERRTAREFEALNTDYRDQNRNAVLSDAGLFAVVEAVGTGAVAVLLWSGASDLATGAIGAGTLVAFMQYIRRFFVPVRDLSTKYTVLQSAFASAERILQFQDEPVSIASAPDARRLTRFERDIEIRDVSFAYRTQVEESGWVLRDINLTIRRGEKIALVGATGSGKTTLLKLIGRIYDVDRGRIYVDGQDIRDVNLDDLRRLFAVVPQDVYLFSGTLMHNLTMAERVTEEAARRAAKAVHLDEILQRFPHGFETEVRDAGSNLSAGERQVLAFARALALDPQVLILDEATSNVDAETEARIQAGLEVLLAQRTAIVVAHRLSTIRQVDRIVVFGRGQIIEQGSHAELMAAGGAYRKLVDLQLGK